MMTREEVLEAMKRPETERRLLYLGEPLIDGAYYYLLPSLFDHADWSMAEEPKPVVHLVCSEITALTECNKLISVILPATLTNDRSLVTCHTCLTCLALKPKPEPVMVPLGPEDVPPGSVVRSRCIGKSPWSVVLGIRCDNGAPVGIATPSSVGWTTWTWEELRKLEISRDGGKSWSRCEKEKP